MLKAGRTQTLTVSRTTEHGIYLADEEQAEVLLPNRYTSLADKVGDRKEVFVYHDSEDRLVATTEQPLLRVGEAGYLRVVDKTAHGAFLDWGLHGKGPLPAQPQPAGRHPHRARSYVVYLYEDNVTGRCVATTKLKSFVNNDPITVEPRGSEVDAAGRFGERDRLPRDRRQPPLGHALPQPAFPPGGRGRPPDGLRAPHHRGQPDRREPPADRIRTGAGHGRGAAATAARQRRASCP